MALRMLCDMHQKATERAWKLLFAYRRGAAKSVETRPRTRPSLRSSAAVSSAKQKVMCRARFEPGLQERRLGFVKRSTFCISQQSIHAAGDMPQMESDRSDSVWPSVQLLIREVKTPFPKVFLRHSKACSTARGTAGTSASVPRSHGSGPAGFVLFISSSLGQSPCPI